MAEGFFRAYQEKKLRQDMLDFIGKMNNIIMEYEAQGYVLTVRQVYYQMVARGYLENVVENYSKVQSALNTGRMCGLVSWTALEDRSRNLRGVETWADPSTALRECATAYKADLWKNQDIRPEVWIEKDALVGVISGICATLRVDFFACRGYNSQSEQWRAGRRFLSYYSKGQRPVVLHLGDHDPSGLDMTRDNRERLSLFCGTEVQVVRLGLNMDQIERLQPPPNPAKVSDPRANDYIARYGDQSWELDALPPNEISRLIEDAVLRLRNPAKWDAALAQEVEERQLLTELAQEI